MEPDRPPSRIWPARLGDRRALVLGGLALAGLIGLVAAVFAFSPDDGALEAPPVNEAGLVVQTGRDDDIKLDEHRPLKCYVGGQLVGELTVADCARRNGIAPGALDVGLDKNGALAGAGAAAAEITPLPPDLDSASAPIDELASPGPRSPGQPAPQGAAQAGPEPAATAPCWLYIDGAWSRSGEDQTLPACARALLATRCEPAGPADLARWGDHSLRLAEGRVEWMADERGYSPLSVRPAACPAAARGQSAKG